MQKRALVIIGIIVLVAIILGGAFLYMQKSNSPAGELMANVQSNSNVQNSNTETADWKTYTNVDYNYSIEYPPDWTFREYSDSKDSAMFFLVEDPNNEIISTSNFDRGKDYCNISLLEYVKHEIKKEPGLSSSSIEKIDNINGIEAYKITLEYKPSMYGVNTLFVTYFGNGNQDCKSPQADLSDKNYLNIYDQMIKTFKFTK